MKKKIFLFVFMVVLSIAIFFLNINAVNLPSDSSNLINITIHEIELKNIIPQVFNVGDSQFSLQVLNTKNETINNVAAFVTGKGFSTYDVVPVEVLNPGERGYVLVLGNFREVGEINLTIKINQDVFYQIVNVVGQNSNQSDDLQKQEEEKRVLLLNMSSEVNYLRENYSSLENEITQKKDDGYDVSNINLDYLDKYIRDAQSSIIAGDVNGARVSLDLAKEEYLSLKTKIDNVKKISFFQRVKENIFVFAALASILALLITLLNNLRIKKRLTDAKDKLSQIKQKKK